MVIDFSNLGGGGGGGEYVLPTATKTRLGGIKVGDGLEYKNDGTINVTGTTETDNITTEIVAEKLQANAIIDVDALPSTGIKANSVYGLNVQKLYDVDGEEMTPLLIYSANSESITFSENGMDFDGVVTPFSSFTDSFVNGYVADNYFIPDFKATSSEKYFVQLGENSYAYIGQIENKKVLYFRDGNEWKEVGGDIELDELTTEMDGDKLQANAIIDVTNLPTTGIKPNTVYRRTTQVITPTPLVIYTATSDGITISMDNIHIQGEPSSPFNFANIEDSLVDEFISKGYFTVTDIVESVYKSFIKLDQDSYSSIDTIKTTRELYFRDGSKWKKVGEINLDELTTEMDEGKLQANAIIDVENLPTLNIKENSIYRKDVQKLYDVENKEITPLAIYSASSELITFTENGMDFDGVVTPFSSITDSLVEDYLAQGYLTTTDKATSSEKNFVKVDTDSYAYIDRIENTKVLFYRDGNEWKQVGSGESETIDLDGLTTEMVNEKLQANAIIDVTTLPTTGIKANSVYRRTAQVIYDIDGFERTPLAIYTATSDDVEISPTDNEIYIVGKADPYYIPTLSDATVENVLVGEGYFTITETAESPTKSFIKADDENHDYFTIGRIENVNDLYYRDGNEWKKVGEINLDNETTEMVDNKLQSNAIIDVENLPITDIKANSVYRKDVQRFYDENDEELTPLAIYVDSSSTISITQQGIQLEGEEVTPWSSIDDETVEGYLSNGYFTVEDKAVSNLNSFIKTGTDSYSYIYRLVTEKELFYRNGNVWKMIGGGGGGTTIELDEVTTEMADNKLQANALVRVNALPSTDIKANSLYAVTENVSYTNSEETKSFAMHKTFKRDGNNWVSISTISLTGEEYEHLSEAQKMDGTVYIVDDLTPVITDEFSYNILPDKPEINGITLQGSLSLEDINVYSRTDVNNLLTNKGEVEFVNQLPVTPDENTWYYSKKYEDGTDVPDDKRALYIVLDDVTVYNYMGVVGDVEMETGDTLSGSEHLVTSSQVVKKEMSTKVNKYNTQVNIETDVNDATLWTNLAQIGTDDKKTDSSMVFNAGTCYLIGSVSPTNTAQIYQFIVTGSVGASAINKKITLINPLTNEIFTKSMDSGTWQAWKGGKKYKHTLVRYNTDSFEYTMGWTSVISNKKTMSVDDFKTWLNEKGYTTVTNSYYWCGGCCGTTEVRNGAGTGKAYVGRVASGVFYDGTNLFFKWDFNGTTQINPARCKVYTEELN